MSHSRDRQDIQKSLDGGREKTGEQTEIVLPEKERDYFISLP